MTNLNDVANLDWKVDMVSPEIADAGSRIVNWLTSAIHRMWDALDVDWDQWSTFEGGDGDYFPNGGCCGF